jgi:GntR family transcriptional regulator
MVFTVSQSTGQPIYAQIVQQVRHAVEIGVLKPGDSLPAIRALAEQLVVSPNTVVKAYSELEHGGVITLKPGSGAYVSPLPRGRSRADRLRTAQEKVRVLVQSLQDEGFSDEEIQRCFEAELHYPQHKS